MAASRGARVARRPETYLSFAFLVLSTLIFGGLRLVRGSADPVDELGNVIIRNIQRNNVIAAASAVPLVLGFGWVYAAFVIDVHSRRIVG